MDGSGIEKGGRNSWDGWEGSHRAGGLPPSSTFPFVAVFLF